MRAVVRGAAIGDAAVSDRAIERGGDQACFPAAHIVLVDVEKGVFVASGQLLVGGEKRLRAVYGGAAEDRRKIAAATSFPGTAGVALRDERLFFPTRSRT